MLGRYRHYMALMLTPALAASAVASVVIARRGLRPLSEIAATARRIGPEWLGERIAVEGLPAELGDLAWTFNVMLDRLQGSFGRLERFSGDIAHELRTPVHAIRNVAEVALATSLTRDEDREALAACLESADHLSRLIERLLFLARADDPRTVLELETFDLASELAAVREFYAPAAEEAGIELAVSARPPGVPARPDPVPAGTGQPPDQRLDSHARRWPGGHVCFRGTGGPGRLRLRYRCRDRDRASAPPIRSVLPA